MNIDPKKYPTLYKAHQLEQEGNKLRSTLEYRREAHLFFAPRYTKTEVEAAKKKIAAYQKDCGTRCICDGYCRSYPNHAFHIMEEIRNYELRGKALGL